MNNKGVTLISLILTVIIILILTSAMIFNTKNQRNISLGLDKINIMTNNNCLHCWLLNILNYILIYQI